MSSYVAKSKKTFQPKAPARRAATSATPSQRDSQEPPRISVTPQPSLDDASTVTPVDSNAPNAANNLGHAPKPVPTALQAHPSDSPAGARPLAVAETSSIPRSQVDASVPSTSATQVSTVHTTKAHNAASSRASPAVLAASQDNSTPARVTDTSSLQKSQEVTKSGGAQDPASAEAASAASTFVISTGHELAQEPPSAIPQNVSIPNGGINGAQQSNTQQEGASALLQLSQANVRERGPRGSSATDSSQPAADGGIATNSVQTEVETAEDGTTAGAAPAKKSKRAGRKRKALASENRSGDNPEDEAAEEADGATSGQPKKRQRNSKAMKSKTQPKASTKPRSKAKQTQTVEDEAAAILADGVRPKRNPRRAVPETAADEDDEEGSESDEEQKLRRKRREPTPEDAEQTRIDPSVVTMADLETLKTGVRSTREGKLRERDEEQRARKQADAEIQERIDSYEGNEVPEDDEEALEYLERKRLEQEEEDAKKQEEERIFKEQQEWTYKPSGRYGTRRKTDTELLPTEQDDAAEDGEEEEVDYEASNRPGATIVVDGQIVANPEFRVRETDTMQMAQDKHITDISHRIHEGSFRHKAKRFNWTEVTIERFYEGLRVFGMDFGMIATIIPGASRTHVKSLWRKEEKHNTAKINEALLPKSRRSMAVSEIEEIRGTTLKDPKEWEEEKYRREQVLRDEKEKARLDAEAELRGPSPERDENEEDERNEIDYENPHQQGNGRTASQSGSDNDGDNIRNGPNGLISSIEDLDDDGIVRSAETDVPDAEVPARGDKSRVSASKRGGRGRGRGRGRAGRGRAR